MNNLPIIIPTRPRSRGLLLADVATIDFEHNPELQRRALADGIVRTFCNVGVRLLLALAGVYIPPLLANDLYDWFYGAEAALDSWRKVEADEAAARAELGFPTIGVWKNPDSRRSGHIVHIVPSVDGSGLHCCQAGFRNFSNEPIERSGLRKTAYAFWTRD